MARLPTVTLAGLCAIQAACLFAPDIQEGSLRCGHDDSCPPEFHCMSDGRCYRDQVYPFALDQGQVTQNHAAGP